MANPPVDHRSAALSPNVLGRGSDGTWLDCALNASGGLRQECSPAFWNLSHRFSRPAGGTLVSTRGGSV
jgi:hypothetical protein